MLALHTYLLDDAGKVFARLTTFADDEDEAVDLMEELDFQEANDSFEILETVDPLDAATLRSVSDAQDRGDDEEPEEGDEDEEEQ